MEPARLNGMKLIFKTLAAGLFAFSMANAQDDVPADAALAPASDKPTMARSELPVGADISNRYLERVFYHWKDNKEKGIIKVFIHTDELAEEREPDVLNYDVLYRDADNNVIFWKDHVAKCVKCFGKPVVDGPTPSTPKALVYDWDPKKIDDTTKTMVEGELPAEVYMITKDNDIRNLKSRWIGPSDKEQGESEFVRAYRFGSIMKYNDKNAFAMAFVYKKGGKFFYVPEGYGYIDQGVYKGVAFPEKFYEVEVTDFKEIVGKSPIEEVQEAIKRGPTPVKMADLPKQTWKGPKIEKELKALVKGYKIKKLIITSDSWEYRRNFFGFVLYRWVGFDIVYDGKNKDGKKATMYKSGFVAKQMSNGSGFDKNLIMTGSPVSWNREVLDWK